MPIAIQLSEFAHGDGLARLRQRELEIVSLGHVTIVTHPRSKTGVPWCQSPTISLKTDQARDACNPARFATAPPPPSFLIVDILSEEFERADRRGNSVCFLVG
jgi:hypothetical protein